MHSSAAGTRMRKPVHCLAGTALALINATAIEGLPQYEISIIEAPACPGMGIPPSFGSGINDHGISEGYFCNCLCFTDVPFRWDGGLILEPLDLPRGFVTAAPVAINNNGTIVGTIGGIAQPAHAFVYSKDLWQLFSPPEGFHRAEATAVNDRGTVIGRIGNIVTGPANLAVIWDDDEPIELNLPMGPQSGAEDVNNAGQIAGWMGSALSTGAHGFIWQDGEVVDIGVIDGGFTAEPLAISEDGLVVGAGRRYDPKSKEVVTRAFLYDGVSMIDLGTLPGFRNSVATDLLDSNMIVGFSWDAIDSPGEVRAVIWRDGEMYDLSDFVAGGSPGIAEVWDITHSGHIVGSTIDNDVVVLAQVIELAGDVSGDGTVGPADLALILGTWGACDGASACAADLNRDGFVDPADLAIMLGHWETVA